MILRYHLTPITLETGLFLFGMEQDLGLLIFQSVALHVLWSRSQEWPSTPDGDEVQDNRDLKGPQRISELTTRIG